MPKKTPGRANNGPMPIRASPGQGKTLGKTTTPTTTIANSPSRDKTPRQASEHPKPMGGSPDVDLFEPTLALSADVLDDLEQTRIANENRLRQLVRSEADSDGEERGFGLDDTNPVVAALQKMIAGLFEIEGKAVLNLEKVMKAHPLGEWQRAQHGIGAKQCARLIAAIGDPYIRPAYAIENEDGTVTEVPAAPRTVSQLWAYSGYHTLPIGQARDDTHIIVADGGKLPTSSHLTFETHKGTAAVRGKSGNRSQSPSDPHPPFASVAAKRKKGERANWSADAKMRAFLIAEKTVQLGKAVDSPYYEAYAKRKANTEGRTHVAPCVRCGPSGKPALKGSVWSDGHRHADALRIVAKEILKGLWIEAKRLHEEEK